MGHLNEEQLNDFVDGLLPPEEYRLILRHVTECGRCRAEVRHLQTLVEGIDRLPKTHPVPSRVWHGVAGETANPRTPSWTPIRLAMAAGLVMTFLGGGLVWQLRQPATVTPASTASVPATESARVRALEEMAEARAGFEAASRELLQHLEESRDKLPPNSARAMEESLVILDEAISNLQEALARDPGDVRLVQRSARAYQQKLALLRLALRLARNDL